MHPRGVLHRVGDQADLEQIDVGQIAALGVARETAGAVTEREAGHRAAFDCGSRAAVDTGATLKLPLNVWAPGDSVWVKKKPLPA